VCSSDLGSYPGYDPSDSNPNGEFFVEQLLLYTDYDGNTSEKPGSPFLFGPYLRPPFPVNPINGFDTVTVKATPSSSDPTEGSVGWVAVLSHGYFGISAEDDDLELVGVTSDVLKLAIRGLAKK